jgi:hypothetical protein
MLRNTLEGLLGKNINAICPNNFHQANENHCAHFVSHVLEIPASFNCKEYKGGAKPGANIRVHEVFGLCPRVGTKAQMDMGREQIVFVTLAANVNVATKTMINIPQKHMGIYSGGHVYHYSNTGDKVVKQTLADFETTFQNAYSGVQGIFFGHFPAGAGAIPAPTAAEVVTGVAPQAPDFKLEKEGKQWFATRKGETARFYVGREIADRGAGYFGLFLRGSEYYGPEYRGDDYAARFGHFAYLLELSGYCESKNRFNLINTYDRAKFTFGFYQLAAHTPNDNLILLMRDLVGSGIAKKHFADLKVIDGALHQVDADGGTINLERPSATGPGGEEQLQAFMDYLNPRRKELDREEVLAAARIMHLANTSAEAREVQVERSAKIMEKKMARWGTKYHLDGKLDTICGVISDIHHQGRASVARVKEALASSKPLDNLININANYAQRASDLRTIIKKLTDAGRLGQLRYHAASNTFG